MITFAIRDAFGLVCRSLRSLSDLTSLAKVADNEERAAQSRNEDNRNSDSGYSCCTNTVGAVAGGLNDGSIARGWIGDGGTSCDSMRYGYDVAWRRCVEGCL